VTSARVDGTAATCDGCDGQGELYGPHCGTLGAAGAVVGYVLVLIATNTISLGLDYADVIAAFG
jgi:uncharacterized membrane protein